MTGTLRTGPISFSLFALSTSRARCSRTVRAPQEWGKGIFPMVPGHEIAGVVESVGEGVTKFKVGRSE